MDNEPDQQRDIGRWMMMPPAERHYSLVKPNDLRLLCAHILHKLIADDKTVQMWICLPCLSINSVRYRPWRSDAGVSGSNQTHHGKKLFRIVFPHILDSIESVQEKLQEFLTENFACLQYFQHVRDRTPSNGQVCSMPGYNQCYCPRVSDRHEAAEGKNASKQQGKPCAQAATGNHTVYPSELLSGQPMDIEHGMEGVAPHPFRFPESETSKTTKNKRNYETLNEKADLVTQEELEAERKHVEALGMKYDGKDQYIPDDFLVGLEEDQIQSHKLRLQIQRTDTEADRLRKQQAAKKEQEQQLAKFQQALGISVNLDSLYQSLAMGANPNAVDLDEIENRSTSYMADDQYSSRGFDDMNRATNDSDDENKSILSHSRSRRNFPTHKQQAYAEDVRSVSGSTRNFKLNQAQPLQLDPNNQHQGQEDDFTIQEASDSDLGSSDSDEEMLSSSGSYDSSPSADGEEGKSYQSRRNNPEVIIDESLRPENLPDVIPEHSFKPSSSSDSSYDHKAYLAKKPHSRASQSSLYLPVVRKIKASPRDTQQGSVSASISSAEELRAKYRGPGSIKSISLYVPQLEDEIYTLYSDSEPNKVKYWNAVTRVDPYRRGRRGRKPKNPYGPGRPRTSYSNIPGFPIKLGRGRPSKAMKEMIEQHRQQWAASQGIITDRSQSSTISRSWTSTANPISSMAASSSYRSPAEQSTTQQPARRGPGRPPGSRSYYQSMRAAYASTSSALPVRSQSQLYAESFAAPVYNPLIGGASAAQPSTQSYVADDLAEGGWED